MTAALRFPTERSRLRRHPEPADADAYRNPFQHDRDRIIHSRAFRRLAGKTQVTTLPDSHHSRTRLTHTIEVSQVARTVASALDLNADLVEALALGHDLGHPPLGHTGESALNEEMRLHGLRFDHNFHALRIVEHFERRYAAFRGLNLTFEVREGLVKHSRDLDPADTRFREYLPHSRPLLEAQIIDGADEIAYLSADLEDAVSDGFIVEEQIVEAVPSFAELAADTRARYPDASVRHVLREVQRRLVGRLVRGLIEGVRATAEASGATSWEQVRLLPRRIAVPSDVSLRTMAHLRALLAETYYNAAATRRVAKRYADRLGDLFRYFVDHPEALPESYVEQLGDEPLPQLVCDYIAGMTDTYLLQCYGKVFGGVRDEEPCEAVA